MNLPILKYFDEFKHKSIKAYLFFCTTNLCNEVMIPPANNFG